MSKARKMTKNHYYRDDPGFVVLQAAFVAILTLAFGFATSSGLLRIVYTIIYECGINFFVVGALVASATWCITNRLLMGQQVLMHEVRREVEWQFCFDIHCNSYFVFFAFSQVLHFVVLPVVTGEGFFARMIANALYAVGLCFYFYVTFKGFVELPMLERQQVFLYPAVGVATLAVLGTLTTHINMSHFVLYHTWGRA